jgi:hypothetical protein
MFYEPATVVKSWMDIDLYQIVLLVFVTIKTGGGPLFFISKCLEIHASYRKCCFHFFVLNFRKVISIGRYVLCAYVGISA